MARVKAYQDLTRHHDSVFNDLTRQGGSSNGTSEIAEAEENFRKSVSSLVSTVVTEGAKVPGERGAALISSILRLVPSFSPSPVPTPTIDLPAGMECRIILGDAPRNIPAGQHVVSSLPSSPLTGGAGVPTVVGRSTIRFGQAVTPARRVHATRLSFLQTTCEHPLYQHPRRGVEPQIHALLPC